MSPNPPRVRPRFELSSRFGVDEVRARVKRALAAQSAVEGLVLRERIELIPHREARHFWSPQLTIDLEATDDGTTLRSRFGPHPHVWTLYVAMHATGALGTTAALVFGFSQYLVGQAPWALVAVPASPVLAALVWALAFVGQGLGAEQMYALRRFVEEALEEPV